MIRGWMFLAGISVIGWSWGVTAQADGSVTYSGNIRGVMARRCLACHGPGSPTLGEFMRDQTRYKGMQKGPRMDSYESLLVFVNGPDAGALMRRLDDGRNTANGKPGNMYVHLGDTDAERAGHLQLFKRWVGHWTLKRRPAMTAAELKSIQAPR